ncbi:MAG: hypothetical protein ACI9VI_003519, partial [Candidatus Azotimanducaceae bacterium]
PSLILGYQASPSSQALFETSNSGFCLLNV